MAEGITAGLAAAGREGEEASVADWICLLKPRVLALVVFTGAVGLALAPQELGAVLSLAAILAIAAGAGSAGAINMWYDRDIDALMRRTCSRPLPAGRIEPASALGFGVVLSVGSVLVMGLATNMLAALLLAVSIAFYVFIYTMWLKRRTPQNIVIGGAAGAFPPLIGWAASSGSIGLLPLLLFAIIFFWTPPHFWALSLFASGEYERAHVPMLPVVAGARRTRREIMAYTLLLVAVSLLPSVLGLAGWIYGAAAAVLGAGFLIHAWQVLRDAQDPAGLSLSRDAPAKACFRFSITYLFLLFAALAVDHLLV